MTDNWFLPIGDAGVLAEISKGKPSGLTPESLPVGGFIDNNFRFSRFSDEIIASDKFKNIAAYKVSGLITMGANWYSGASTEELKSELIQQESNSSINAHLLLFNSGGGEATDIHTCATIIHKLKKPKIAFLKGQCNSAAYYLASACDIIIAQQETDIIGSIGIMAVRWFDEEKNDFTGKVVLYAPQSKDKNKIFENTPKAIEEYIDKFLVPHADVFIRDVKKFRPSIKDIDGKVFSGGVYTAKQAIENGLIDKIDTLENTLENILQITIEKQKTDMSVQSFLGLEKLFGLAANSKDPKTVEAAGVQVISDMQNEVAQAKADGVNEGMARSEAELATLKSQFDTLSGNFASLVKKQQDIESENNRLRTQNTELSGLLAAKKLEDNKLEFNTPPNTLGTEQAKVTSRNTL